MEHAMHPILSYSLFVLVFLVGLYIRSAVKWEARARGRPLPPGPRPLPFIGNVFNMPRYKPWIRYRELCAKYGDIVHLRVLRQSIVVLGSPSVIIELLEKRSANTSDRKQTLMIELTGNSINSALMPYGQLWRRHRRAFWQHYYPKAALEYRPIQRLFAHIFLQRLLEDPLRFERHIRYTFAGAVLKVTYNIDIDEGSEDYYGIVETALEGTSQGLVPGRFLVESFPFLRYIPTWFPGARSQRLFAKWRDAMNQMKNIPYSRLQESLKQQLEEVSQPSVVEKLLKRATSDGAPLSGEDEDIIKNTGAVAFEAGAETTASTLKSMLLAMSLYPDVLAKAQAELDAVVGPHRLPDFCDQDSLVYMQAIVKETLRWQNVLPLGLPHCNLEDEELNGYFIPAGTMLIPCTWACMHDPDKYEDPESYRPERFIRNGKLDPNILDPAAFVFGHGRRVCPGRYFAEAALFINMASVLHVFDITPPIGEDGLPIKIVPRMSDGLGSFPEDCRCTIKPRSATAEALIRAHAASVHED